MNFLIFWILCVGFSVGITFLLQLIVGKKFFNNPFWSNEYHTKALRIYNSIIFSCIILASGPVGAFMCFILFATTLYEYYEYQEEEYKKILKKEGKL